MKKQTWEEYREDFDNAFNGAIENGHPAVVVAWVQAKSLVQLALADYEEELIEGLDYLRKHSPKAPKDVEFEKQGAWYIGRLDGILSVQEFIKKGKI